MRALGAIAATLTLLASAPVTAQERAERFDYEVEWGYADVARVSIQQGCSRDGYRPAFLSAKSLGVIDQLHAFEIRLDTFAGADGRTLEGRTYIKEDGVPRRYRTRFATSGAAVTNKQIRDKKSQLKLSLRPGTFDLLSWFTALRAEDLKAGAKHEYYVWDGWKLARVTAKVGKAERIWTPAGTFTASKIDVTRVRLHHRGKKYEAKSEREDLGVLWLTADAVPVAMDFKAPVGLAKVRLTRSTQRACSK